MAGWAGGAQAGRVSEAREGTDGPNLRPGQHDEGETGDEAKPPAGSTDFGTP